ncbi:hypothetical protein F1P15_01135 [Campylobacter jejuni]|nr:hypothetical protein [Campylobacter jejuni]
MNEASRYTSINNKGLTIKLINDLNINEGIVISNTFMPFLTIDFNEYSIIADGSSYDALIKFDNSILKSINNLKIDCNGKSLNSCILFLNNCYCYLNSIKSILNCLGIAIANSYSDVIIFNSDAEISAGNSGYNSKGMLCVGGKMILHSCNITQNSGLLSQSVEVSGLINNFNCNFLGSVTNKSQATDTWTTNGYISQ